MKENVSHYMIPDLVPVLNFTEENMSKA
jgi:hypothetical protein